MVMVRVRDGVTGALTGVVEDEEDVLVFLRRRLYVVQASGVFKMSTCVPRSLYRLYTNWLAVCWESRCRRGRIHRCQ